MASINCLNELLTPLLRNIHLHLFLFLMFVGDPSQLRPLKTIGKNTVTTETLFDLSISKSMQHFTIQGQFRTSNSYTTFLGNYLSKFNVINKLHHLHMFPSFAKVSQGF